MNYRGINLAIVNSKDVSNPVVKSTEFYKYLLDNNVGYYYTKFLSKNDNELENEIVDMGNEFNSKYLKTLRFINETCNRHNIEFLLFKSVKYLPEVAAGDIDIFVKEKDFHGFLKVFERLGFSCMENEPLKGKCERKGFCKIEPRVNLSFHGMAVLTECKIWKHVETFNVEKEALLKTTKAFDLFSLFLNILYGPKYLDLYLYLVFKQVNSQKILTFTSDKSIIEDMKFLINNLAGNNALNNRFPLFLSNFDYFLWWIKKMAFSKSFGIASKLKHLIFFFYMKYKYLFFNKLQFSHNWL